MMKKIIISFLLLACVQMLWAQQPVNDFFQKLTEEEEETIEELITTANAELDRQFFVLTHSQSNPQVRSNLEVFAHDATNSIFLIVNIYDDGRSHGSVIVSDDLKEVYAPSFLSNVGEEVMGNSLDGYPGSTEVTMAFGEGFEPF